MKKWIARIIAVAFASMVILAGAAMLFVMFYLGIISGHPAGYMISAIVFIVAVACAMQWSSNHADWEWMR